MFRWLFSTCSSVFWCCFLHVGVLWKKSPPESACGKGHRSPHAFESNLPHWSGARHIPSNRSLGKKPRWRKKTTLDQTGHHLFWFHPGKHGFVSKLLVSFTSEIRCLTLCWSDFEMVSCWKSCVDQKVQMIGFSHISCTFPESFLPTKASKITTNSRNSSRISQSSCESTKSFTLSRKGNRFNSPPQTPSPRFLNRDSSSHKKYYWKDPKEW